MPNPDISLDYSATLEFLYSQLPMYQRVGALAMKKDLTNIRKLCADLGQPQEKFPSIHVAGTNGKGSTTHLLAAILQQKGLKVGVYTSPHYKDFRERIKINGELVSEGFIIDFVQKNKAVIDSLSPSFFEITVAMAFQYFAEQEVDIAVVETGLGGRLDSTNIVTPILSVITNISLDHQEYLGDTLPEIAAEKAGIIKKGVPVVITEDNPETAPVFRKKAQEMDAPIYFAKETYQVIPTIRAFTHSIFNVYKHKRLHMQDVESDIAGQFQAENLRGVIQAVDILNEQGYGISQQEVFYALRKVRPSTYFIGRMQVLRHNPLVLADSGHNAGALAQTLSEFKDLRYRQLHIVLGFVKDKDISAMLSFFPKDAHYYFTQADIPRALPVAELQPLAAAASLQGDAYPTVKEALAAAKAAAGMDDCIFIGGSSFVVAEAI